MKKTSEDQSATQVVSYSVKHMPENERPRERLSLQGPEALSSAELIAVILGSGMKGKSVIQLSHELLAHFGSLEKLADATIAELRQIKGLGDAKAIQLVAAFNLGLRAARGQVAPPKVRVESPKQAYDLVKKDLQDEKQELFLIIMQDIKRQVIKCEVIAIGTLSNILVHPREVFYPAIRNKASSIILVHNHPSGDPTPSPQDRHLTVTLIEVGRTIGIPVTDHIIVGRDCFISLRQEGIEF